MPDVPELRKAGELMKADWEKLGASVTLKVFEPSTFAAEVLSPRKFDALFYGQINGRVPDPFAYWHSSQRNAPGLNVALYANKNIDKFLEDARKESDPVDRTLLLTKFVIEIANDTPAVFVYSPDFLYATSEKVRGMHTGLITTESERFLDVMNWYIESEQVWKWFADKMTRV
jgi:peptide/nickel transport system substrate-binding protein